MGVCNLSKNEYKKNIYYKKNIEIKKESNEIKKRVNENNTNHATKIPLNIINQFVK
jgi:hypothetical protein